jgi:hypothetical protein
MEIGLHQLEEEVRQIFFENFSVFIEVACSKEFFFNFFFYVGVIFFLGEQIRDFADGENVVNIINESFINNLVVGEEEDSTLVFKASFLTPALNIFSEFFHPVILGNLNLPELIFCNKRGELS